VKIPKYLCYIFATAEDSWVSPHIVARAEGLFFPQILVMAEDSLGFPPYCSNNSTAVFPAEEVMRKSVSLDLNPCKFSSVLNFPREVFCLQIWPE
jgi:hypothetical protein